MSEWKEFIESLNDYAGLFALLALVATIVVPYILYNVQKKNERQAAQDELEAMTEMQRFPMTIEERKRFERKCMLEKKVRKQ